MPKDTFLKLPEEKKIKILKAAKKEFARVSVEEASIKKIIEDAKIARGSFYQYFESKEDLLIYILSIHFKFINDEIEKQIKRTNGDIFELFVALYDFMDKNCMENEDMNFYKKIFENIKTSQDYIFSKTIMQKAPRPKEYLKYINTNNLRIDSEKDLEIIEKMLFTITNKAIVMRFKCNSKEEAREEYLKQIEYLKLGILKKEEEIC